jgi:hypothetical protein
VITLTQEQKENHLCGVSDLPECAQTDGNFLKKYCNRLQNTVYDYRPLKVAINTIAVPFLAMMGKSMPTTQQ